MVAKGENQPIKDKKTKSQTPKVMFLALICLGVATFVLGAVKIFQGIYNPFAGVRIDRGGESVSGTDAENTAYDLIRMQTEDTDGDGLSDYDEVYVHNTSRFLEDTDSDGFSDAQEVASGYDPNCVVGKDCRGVGAVVSDESDVAPEITLPPDSLMGDLDVDSSDLGMTAQELRKQLLESGELTEEQKTELEMIDDETLVKTFLQVMQEQEQQ